MSRFLLFFLLFSSPIAFAQEKVIMKKHADGSAQVIYYYETWFHKRALIRKEVYYSKNQLEYSGEIKNGKEHGSWLYYWENGKPMAVENWKDGNEHGIWKEYDENGNMRLETEYRNGKVVRTKNY